MKNCTQCGVEKPISEFANKSGKPASRCKLCHNAYYKEYYRDPEKYGKHKERIKATRKQYRGSKYGLSELEYVEFKNRNNGLCELCNINLANAVDHNHITNSLRGHLCMSCNTSLGKLGDNIEGLQRALNYVTNPPYRKGKK